MSLWSKLFGAKAEDRGPKFNAAPDYVAPRPGVPSRVVLVRKRLALEFHAHDTVEGATGNFLSVISEGLNRYKQRELAITVRLGPNEDATGKMRELGRFFGTVMRWAQEGVLVDSGDFTQFGERGLFGGRKNGLVYADARGIGDVALPVDALAAVLVDEEELRVAMGFGAYRLLARLGEHYRRFPFPTWTDMTRPSLATPRESETQLSKLKRIRGRGVSYLVGRQRVSISLPPSARAVLAQGVAALAPGAPFALMTDLAAEANALAVWYPGQQELKTIAAAGSDGSLVTGSFLVITPGAQSNRALPLEDGYCLSLSTVAWQQVSAALLQQQPVSLEMAGGVMVELAWQTSETGSARNWLA